MMFFFIYENNCNPMVLNHEDGLITILPRLLQRSKECRAHYSTLYHATSQWITGLQITLKLQGPCGPLTDQVLLAHTDILGPTFSIKC